VPTNIIESITDGTPITVTGVNVINYFPSGTSFYDVTLPYGKDVGPAFTPVSDDQTTKLMASGKTLIILIHGWQIFGDASDSQGIWINFIDYFYSDSDLKNKFELYSFRYDSSKSIDSNSAALASIISTCFPSHNVVIIAHSMGG
jgi:hypothetical protein